MSNVWHQKSAFGCRSVFGTNIFLLRRAFGTNDQIISYKVSEANQAGQKEVQPTVTVFAS